MEAEQIRTLTLWFAALAVVLLAVAVIENAAVMSMVSLRGLFVPRVIAGVGLVAAVLQVCSVAMPLFGHDVVFPMLAPLGLIQLVLAGWLMARGFRNDRSFAAQ